MPYKFTLEDIRNLPPAPPTNFDELITYLKVHPRVGMASSSSLLPVGPVESFLRYEDGLMWWRTPDGVEHHFPVNCGMVAAESGIVFYSFGFTFTKFGIVCFVTYMGGGMTCHDQAS